MITVAPRVAPLASQAKGNQKPYILDRQRESGHWRSLG